MLFTPETMLANKMMRRMMNQKRSMAIVVDEFGGTAGLITLEDIVEEIFGEIEDEHDKERLEARETEPGVYEFSGRVEVSQANEMFGLDIKESEDYHTLAGCVMFNLGALPAEGEAVTVGHLLFTVLKMSTTKIELIRVQHIDPQQ